MICVILGHCCNFWRGNWISFATPHESAYILERISYLVNSFHTYAFTLVSGYLFYYLKFEKGKYTKFRSFLNNKLKRLIVPFCFTCLIWVAPIGGLLNSYNFKEMIRRYVLGVSPNQLWFLLMLFWVFIFAWLLSSFINKRVVISSLVVCFIYVVGIIGTKTLPNVFCIWTGCEYLLFFWVGYQIRKNKQKIKLEHCCYLLMPFFLYFWVERKLHFPGVVTSLIQILYHLCGAIGIVGILQILANVFSGWKENKVFRVLSKYSMPMYLFHQQVIYFSIILFNGKVNPYIHACINIVVAMTASIIISYILMKFKVTRFLIGEK